jgi:hypothetical protein
VLEIDLVCVAGGDKEFTDLCNILVRKLEIIRNIILGLKYISRKQVSVM